MTLSRFPDGSTEKILKYLYMQAQKKCYAKSLKCAKTQESTQKSAKRLRECTANIFLNGPKMKNVQKLKKERNFNDNFWIY